jgi:predicted nucleic acid-binding protein
LLERLTEDGAFAPMLWPLEALNGLLVAERRGRLAVAKRRQLAGFLRDLPVAIDNETAAEAWTTTARLAEPLRLRRRYLELAERRGLPLASLNRNLRAAAMALGIAVLGD